MIKASELLGEEPPKFSDSAINKLAEKNLVNLASKCNFRTFLDNSRIQIITLADEVLGTYVVVGANAEEKIVKIPVQEINQKENLKVALTIFDGDVVNGVYLFDVNEMTTGKPRKLYKLKLKEGWVGIKIKNQNKKVFNEHRFGAVLKNYIKNI